MSNKIIDLMGLSRAITKMKEWTTNFVQKQKSNWNAQEGEAGYIENKPFYIDQININTNDIVWDDMEPIGTVQLSQLGTITIYFDDPTIGIFGPLILNEQNEYRGEISAPDSSWDVYLNTNDFVLTLIESNQVGSSVVLITQDITKQLDAIYIPNTVLKTTTQELTEENKNQALANLGIDPVVWKYMCEPYIIESEKVLPDYLRQLLVNNNPLILNLCKIKVVTEMYDEYADANRPIVHFCTPIAHKFDDELDRELSLQCITFYGNAYHTYNVDIDITDGQIYDITEIVPNENNPQ